MNDFIYVNKFNAKTIDFANPKAVKCLNRSLLRAYYDIDYWDFSDYNLCPPIPGRVDYIHYLADLIEASEIIKGVKILDIGTGATCIYPLLGQAEYGWEFVGVDVDEDSLNNAKQIVIKNGLADKISFRFQQQVSNILKGVVLEGEQFTATMCNPPFYKSEEEAKAATMKKLKGLNKDTTQLIRNFAGTQNELWYKGGEKAFLHNYLYESSLFKNQSIWFTSLVSKKDLIRGLKVYLKKLGATKVQVINMEQGNKTSRVLAWSFL